MRQIRNYLAVIAVILAVSFTAVSAQSSSGSRSGQDLNQQIFRKLINLPYYGAFDHISYQVNGNNVTLFGKVADGRNKRDAENAVERIPGIGSVTNRIEILPPSSFDNSIRWRIAREFSTRGGSLYRYLLEPRPSMRIIVEGGHVTLEGFVSNRGDYNLANILANGIPGVFSVTNNLVVGREGPR